MSIPSTGSCRHQSLQLEKVQNRHQQLSANEASVAELDSATLRKLYEPSIEALKAFGDGNHLNQSLWVIFGLGFIGGLIALATPCVWPIIPMTVSFFLKRSGDRRKALRDAFTYGLSIVIIYVALGVIVTSIFGASALNDLSTNAIFNLLFFAMPRSPLVLRS